MINNSGRNRLRSGSAVLLTAAIFLVFITATTAQQTETRDPATDLRHKKQEILASFRASLETLAETYRDQGLSELADEVQAMIPNRDPQRQYIFMPPSQASNPSNDATDLQKQFHGELARINSEYADQCFQLAKLAAENSLGPEAYQLLHETLAYDPEHDQVRRVLGYRKHYELGWVRSAKPTRAKQARIKQKIIGWDKGTYWQINSPHFEIYSAAGEEEGLRLAAILEQTYWVWRQVFFEYWCNVRHLNGWLDGKASDRSSSRQYKIVLFRDRQQYLSDLADVPNIDRSSGYYDEKKRASFFYVAEKPSVSTWRHETIHQLFQENAGANKSVADRGHAWLIEGIAMYFESMQVRGNEVSLGGFDATRLQYARLRFKREGFFMPMELLDSMGREELQNHENVARLYSQACGNCQFMFTAEQGRYRNGFIKFIKELYQQRRVKSSLAERTLPLDQLDRKYKQFLDVTRDDLAGYFLNLETDALALGRAGLQNDDLDRLRNCTQLQWLELSDNPIGDAGIDSLSDMTEITQLFLDVTGITDASAVKLAKLKTLQELDLASTRITDQGIRALGTLQELQVLWLANCRVTDDGIDSLASMPSLQLVDLRKTQVTPAGVEKLKAAIPGIEVMY